MKVPKYRPLATILIVFVLFLGISRPIEAAGFSGVQPLTWASSVVRSVEGFFGHFFSPKNEPTAAPSPTPAPGQEVIQKVIEQAPAPVTNITQVISQFDNGLTLVSPYGDIYPKDGLAPALGTAVHPYSQLNLTKASIDSNGSLMLAGALTVTGFGSGIVHTDRQGHFSTAAIDLGTGDIKGVLPVGGGGTGTTSLTANGVLYGNGTSGVAAVTPGTPGALLQSNGAGTAPSWVTASGLSAGNAASLLGSTWAAPGTMGSGTPNTGAFTTLTASGGVTLSSLTTNGGVLFTNGSGMVAQTGAGTSGAVLHGGATPTYGVLDLGSEVSGTLPLLSGGTGATTPATALANLGGEPALPSGTTAQYLRGDKTFQALTTAVVPEGTNLYYTQGRFDTAFSGKTTASLTEGSNLYYTDARARSALSVSGPLTYNSGTGAFSLGTVGVGSGGTGTTSLMQDGLVYGNGSAALSALTPGASGSVLQSNGIGAIPSWVAASGLTAGNVAYSGVTGGTNTSAAMLVGSGASLGFSGSGTINASSLLGGSWAAPGAIGNTTPGIVTGTTLNATSGVNTGAGAGTQRISSTGVGAFIAGTIIGSQTFTTNAIVDAGALTIATSANGNIGLLPNGTGNVGIGTTLPGRLVSLNGNANAATVLGGANPAVLVTNTNANAVNTKAELQLNIGGLGSSVISGQYQRFNGNGDIGTDLIFGTQANLAGGTVERLRITADGNVGIGVTNPNGLLQLAAGTTTVAPLLFTSGTNLTAPVAGAMEWNGTNLFITQTSGPTRKTIAFTDSVMTGSLGFDKLTAGTNTAAMIVGNGGSLTFSGSGTINASSLLGTTWAIPGAIGATTPNTGAFTTLSLAGNQTWATDNTYNIGANGANRPHNLYLGGDATIGGALLMGNGVYTPSAYGSTGPFSLFSAGSLGQSQYYASSDGLRPSIMSFVDVNPTYTSTTGLAMNMRLEAVPLGSVVVTSGGSGYPTSSSNGSVTFSGGDAITPATAHYVSNSSGVITSVVLDTPGLYRSAPQTITFGGGGSGATAYAAMVGIGKTPIDIRHYDIPDTGGDNSGALFVSTGGNGSFTTYQIQNLRPAGTRKWNMTLQGAIETGTDAGSQAIIAFPGMQFASQERTTIAADIAGGSTPPATISLSNTKGWPIPGSYEYTAPGGGQLFYPATLYVTITDPTTGNSETFGYTAVNGLSGSSQPASVTSTGAGTLTISSRGLGSNNYAFTAASGAYAEPQNESAGVYTRIGNSVSDGFIAQPGNQVFDSTRWGFVVGNKGRNAPPGGVTAGWRLNGDGIVRSQQALGTGQAKGSGFSATGSTGGSYFADDSTVGIGNGGGFFVGVGGSTNAPRHFAGMYGLSLDNSSNSTGDLVLATRNLPGDDALTERLRVAGNGVAQIKAAASLVFGTDNTYDIGASGANRARDFYLARNAVIGGTASVSGVLTVGNGTTNTIESAYGPLQLAYKSGANTWTTGIALQDTTGNVGIGQTNPTLGPLQMASGAYVTSGGVWTNASDRNLKTNFTSLDPQSVLAKIDTLPVTEWNYKREDPSVKHIGPVAQDFYAAFGLGNNNTSISTIDPAGIALLGIQALDQKYAQLAQPSSATISEQSVASLQTSLQSLADRVATLEKQHPSQTPLFFASLSASLQGVSLSSPKDATIAGTLAVQGRTLLNDLGVTGDITTGVIAIHGLDGSIDAIGNTLKLQSLGTGSIDLLAGKVTIDASGNIVAKGEITAKKINIDESDPASASIGTGTLKAGDTAVTISTKAVHTKSRIFLTPEGKTGAQPLEVGGKTDGASFTVQIEHSYAGDISFDWWIVN